MPLFMGHFYPHTNALVWGFIFLRCDVIYNSDGMDARTEAFLKERIFPDLERGRPAWDAPHTEAVVFYAREIARAERGTLDEDVFLIVAYAHDWGYADLFESGKYVGNDDIKKVKKLHARISGEKISILLKNNVFDYLTSEQKERICHLVLMHDRLDELKDRDEFFFMEADTLGQLDISRSLPTFNADDNERYLKKVEKERLPRFLTSYGKKKAEELFRRRRAFYENKSRGERVSEG